MKKYIIISLLALIGFFGCFYLSTDYIFGESEQVKDTIEQKIDLEVEEKTVGNFQIAGVNDTKFCDVNETVSCTTVSNDESSQLLGIPFSIYGMFMYFILFVLGIIGYFKKKDIFLKGILAITFAGVLFNFYLFYLEIFVIKAVCIVCIVCSISLFTMFFISLFNTLKCTTKQ